MNDWTTAPLGDFASVQLGYAFKSSQWIEAGVPVVKIANVKQGRLDLSSNASFVSEADAVLAERFRLKRGDIVIGMTGYVGQVAKVRDDRHLVLNQRVGIFRPNISKIDPAFLYFAVANDAFLAQAQSLAYGSAQPNISPALIESIRVPFPPIQEQRRIAGVLGALDDLIDTNERLARLLFTGLGSFHAKLIRDSITCEVKFFDVFEVDYGGAFKGEFFTTAGTGMPLLRIRDLKTMTSAVWTVEEIPNVPIVRPGDIVAGMDAEFRSTLWLGAESRLNQRVMRIRAKQGGPAFAYLGSKATLARIENYKTGTTVIHLNKGDLQRETVMAPSAEELAVFKKLTDPLVSGIVELAAETENVRRTRDELLPLLMSGKIRVREAEEVVASMTKAPA